MGILASLKVLHSNTASHPLRLPLVNSTVLMIDQAENSIHKPLCHLVNGPFHGAVK